MMIKKYKIIVYEGVMDMVHDGGEYITEFCFPELRLFINEKAVFVAGNLNRMNDVKDMEEIEIGNSETDLAKQLVGIISKKNASEDLLRKELFGKKDAE